VERSDDIQFFFSNVVCVCLCWSCSYWN